MQRKTVLVALLTVLALAGASYLSPWWTLKRMRAAIDDRDTKAFSSHVDYLSLQASYKSQMIANSKGRDADDGGSILGALGEGIVGALAGPMLDVVLDAPGVIEMINNGTPTITRAVISSSITKVSSAENPPAELETAYRGWNRVAFRGVDASEEEGSFILVRTSPWSWKLAEVELGR